jgi:hypothetical protein
MEKNTNTPHSDQSGESRPVHIASVMDDCGTGGKVFAHMTPAEEAEYNAGMAKLAEWG